jgi:hypothetical protein
MAAPLSSLSDRRGAEGAEVMPKRWLEPLRHLLQEKPGHKDDRSSRNQRQPGGAVERDEERHARETDYPTGDDKAGPHEPRKGVDGFIDFGAREATSLVTEYEQLLGDMLKERREKLEALKAGKGNNKRKIEVLLSEIGFVEVELERYQRGLTLFRSKGLPKVGRWGKPEASQHSEAGP